MICQFMSITVVVKKSCHLCGHLFASGVVVCPGCRMGLGGGMGVTGINIISLAGIKNKISTSTIIPGSSSSSTTANTTTTTVITRTSTNPTTRTCLPLSSGEGPLSKVSGQVAGHQEGLPGVRRVEGVHEGGRGHGVIVVLVLVLLVLSVIVEDVGGSVLSAGRDVVSFQDPGGGKAKLKFELPP